LGCFVIFKPKLKPKFKHMLFNIRGIEVDVVLPKSLEEANRRINELYIVRARLIQEIKGLPRRSRVLKAKRKLIEDTVLEIEILKQWTRNANARLEVMLADSNIPNSRELRTEPGLIKHLYLEMHQLIKENRVRLKRNTKLATVLAAAQYWLREHYSTALPATDLVADLLAEEKRRQEEEEQQQEQQNQQQTQEALALLSQLAKQ
jgi:hypothetical protein